MTTWVEALRIVLLASVVHLLDVLHSLDQDPARSRVGPAE